MGDEGDGEGGQPEGRSGGSGGCGVPGGRLWLGVGRGDGLCLFGTTGGAGHVQGAPLHGADVDQDGSWRGPWAGTWTAWRAEADTAPRLHPIRQTKASYASISLARG